MSAKQGKSSSPNGLSLTKVAVKSMKLPPGKNDVVYWDNSLVGFGLRIRAGGKRTWMVQFRDAGGATRKVTIGSVDTIDADLARTEAKKLLGGVMLGNDPTKAKKEARAGTKLGDLVEQYLAYAADRQKASTLEATVRNVRIYAKPLHGSPVKDIDRAAVARLHEKITEKNGRVQANRVLAALSGFFAWSVGKGYRDSNPVLAVPKNAETARERVLSDDEIRTIWAGTASGSDYDYIVRLLLLTGARRSEVGSMQWPEISTDFANGTLWTVPGSRMKNGLPHEVQICTKAHRCLPPMGEGSTSPNFAQKFVFGKAVGGVKRGYSGWSRSKERLDRRLGLEPWGLHDFRRTLSTRLHDAGVQPHVVEALLAHIGHKAGVAGTYNKAQYREQKREALELWESMIGEIVGE